MNSTNTTPVALLDDYQRATRTTAVYEDHGLGTRSAITYCALKLAGEAGEVAEEVGKALYRGDAGAADALPEVIKKELGDVLWYVSQLATEFGFTLSEIAEANLAKLQDRKARGVLKGSGDDR